MPQLTRTFSNPTGTVETTGVDQLEEIRRGRQSSEALAREALAAQMAESAANRQSNQQIQGSFADRASLQDRMLQSQLNAAREQQQLANQGGLDVARINVGPNQAYADLAGRKYADEREDTAAARRLADAYANAELGLVEGITASMRPQGDGIGGIFQNAQQAAGVPGGERAMPQDQAIQNLLRLKNPQAYFESQRRAEDREAQREGQTAQLVASLGTVPGAAPLVTQLAGRLPVFQGIEPEVLGSALAPPQQLINREGREGDLGMLAQRFAARDAATFGFDPSAPDVERIAQERDKLRDYYVQSQRVSPEQATEAANRVVEQQLAPQADRWGTGWIQTLRQRLGIVR